MKPETKFRRAVSKLAVSASLAVKSVTVSMSGYDSRTKQGWHTFSLSLDQKEIPPSDFLKKLEELSSSSEFSGVHALTGLPAQVSMAVRYINLESQRFLFAHGELAPIL